MLKKPHKFTAKQKVLPVTLISQPNRVFNQLATCASNYVCTQYSQ